MPSSLHNRNLGRICGALFAIYAAIFLYLAARHILYPGFLEPMEGDVLQHIERVATGRVPYPADGGDFIPLSYTPFFYFVAAPLYWLLGDSFAGPRLIASLCTIITGLIVCGIAWKESRTRWVAALAGALYFSSYRIMDAYVTCAMPDALFVTLVFAGLWFLAYGASRRDDALWLLFFTLAFWTKQHGAFFFGFAVLYALLFRRNYLSRWIITAALIVGGPIAYLALGTQLGDGFFYHTWVVPGHWERGLFISARRAAFLFACFVPFATLLSTFYIRRVNPVTWFTVSAFLCSGVTMMAAGASNNHYIPFVAALSATAALGAWKALEGVTLPSLGAWFTAIVIACAAMTFLTIRAGHATPWTGPIVGACALAAFFLFKSNTARIGLLVLGQLGVAFYNPLDYLPLAGYQQAESELRTLAAETSGQLVWLPYGHTPRAVVGRSLANGPSWVALEDVTRQVNVTNIDSDLARFYAKVKADRNLYILADCKFEDMPAWSNVAGNFELVRDYGNRFAALRQITPHWFGGWNYPRFLYRHRPLEESAHR